ncbi:MAG: hypothetical protein ACLGQX_08185 [Acidobacteriota bacterium]
MVPLLKRAFLPSLSASAFLLGTLLLAGCGGAMTMDSNSASSSATPTNQVAGPAVQGYVYGGHAPIQGAHVYLLQPGIKGYGSPATSILGTGTTDSPGGYTLTANSSDPNVPSGAEYVTTDSTGAFNLTGAYVCKLGQPVYIYAWGGNIGATTGTASISQIVITNATKGDHGTATYTVTVSSGALFTVGESVTVAGLGGDFTIVNGTQTVTAGGTGTFAFTATDNYGPFGHSTLTDGTYTTAAFGAGGTVTYPIAPTTNPNIVQLATLGNCPSSGNFSTGSTALSYIYLNEVSTVATAYTFQPFTLVGNNNAWDVGTSGTPQALLGIANAANTAAQLYNIQGGGPQSTANDGEGHLANYQTQLNGVGNSGNGVVPEATIDTLANILASCVDSIPPAPGSESTECSSLFSVATDDGASTGTQPTDTATAAINIARYPAGNHSSADVSSSYVGDIFALQSGTVPYVPDLSHAPNDWTIAIDYPYTAVGGYSAVNPNLERAESIAVDGAGQVWISAQGGGNGSTTPAPSINLWSPLGAQISSYSNSSDYIYGYVSVDGSNNAWTGSAISTTGIQEFNNSGGLLNTYGSGYEKAYTVIANASGDAYFFANSSNQSGSTDTFGNFEMWEYNDTGTLLSNSTTCDGHAGSYVYDCIIPAIFDAAGGDNVAHGAIDASGDLWLTSEVSPYQIARVSPTGAEVWEYTTNLQQPEFPSIDGNGNGWIPDQETDAIVYEFAASGGSPAQFDSGNTGADLTSTFGSAIDGNGNIWLTNRCGNYGTCTDGTGTNTIVELNGGNTPGSADLAISPPTNYIPEAQYPATATSFTTMLDDSLNLAIDPSGNVWITNYAGGRVVELVGAAAPVVTPLSVAAETNKFGQKP